MSSINKSPIASIAPIESSNAKIVGGIALFVDGEPITIYAIQQAQRTLNTDKLRATDFLIMEKLKKNEIKRLKIEVSDSQIDTQINQIAQQNGMNLDQFYTAVIKEGMNLTEYRSKLKEQILTQELMRKILFSSNVGQEDELRKYYNEHSHEFVIPKQVDSTKFVSTSKESLEKFKQQGIASALPNNIAKDNEIIDLESLPPQIADVLLITPEKSFSQVLETGDGNFVTFYINKKIDTKRVDFDQAKNYIAQKLMMNNQEKILHDYFERVRSSSKIVFVR
ncbi:hypothetical protein CQA53_00130 [Helicobacter didelphidarum]|uniref:Peptidyl-prolyl cis-trans isomerase n=2 Tax=Helicobacter didelphidarum TaxID=2040648 RepID=A0A3D8IS10_9HELI|nr:hypothetical protein CQA53_00130 [Helicobacter didelphidarum]